MDFLLLEVTDLRLAVGITSCGFWQGGQAKPAAEDPSSGPRLGQSSKDADDSAQ
jgi:hypothetical protein